jgi:dolichyl-phosphate beta-glucosyltransferase
MTKDNISREKLANNKEKNEAQIFLSIVIPAYNEAIRIGQSLQTIKDYLKGKAIKAEIIVADDGSSDSTAEISRKALRDWPEAEVISLPENRGKGAAVREGVLKAKAELVLFTDADLSTPIEELEKFLPLAHQGFAVVIGSRALPESKVLKRQSWLREHMGKTFNLLVRLLLIKGIKDTQCGFKLFRKEAAKEIFSQLKTEGFAFDVEALMIARKLGYRIAQVPVVWINCPDSRVHMIKSSLKMLTEMFKLIPLRVKKWGHNTYFLIF